MLRILQTGWRQIGRVVQSLIFFLSIKGKNFLEEAKVIFSFWKDPYFRRIDLAMKRVYFLKNPYTISRKFLEAKLEEQVHCYGETFLTSMFQIAIRAGITEKDVVIEMGSGRGRATFFLHNFFKCKVIGLECIEEFVEKAGILAKTYHREKVSFFCGDMFEMDPKEASILYFYGSALSEKDESRFFQFLEKTQEKAKIITTSYSLQELFPKSNFQVIDQFTASFLWGEAEIFINQRRFL